MRGRIMRLVMTVVIGTALVVGSTAGPAAASAGVNIVVGNWHCDQGGSIKWSQGLTSMPSGDTKGYIVGNKYTDVGVWYNYKNTYSATVYCDGWVWQTWRWVHVQYYKYIYPNQWTFWPQYAGQTFYL